MWYVLEGNNKYGPFDTLHEATLSVRYLCDSRGGKAVDYPIVTKDDDVKEIIAKYRQVVLDAQAKLAKR